MKIPRSSNSQIKLLLLSRTHFLGIACALACWILNFSDFDFRLVFPDGPTYTPVAARKERSYFIPV
jgi:hypothetical protein